MEHASFYELIVLAGKGLGLVFVFLWLLGMLVNVQEQTFKTTTLWGSRFFRVLKPGLNVKMPWPIEQVDVVMSTKVRQSLVAVTSMTSDNAQITLNARVHYSPAEGRLYQAAYALEAPEEQMKAFLDNFLRAKVKTLKVHDVFGSTNEFQEDLKARLAEKFSEYGYLIDSVLVGEPTLSKQMADAYERKLMAEQAQQAAEAEGIAIKTRMTMKAEAEGASLKIKGEAFKAFRLSIAEGNAEAIKHFLDGVPDDSLNAASVLSFFAGVDERDALREAAASGGHTVYIGGPGNQAQKSDIANVAAALRSATPTAKA